MNPCSLAVVAIVVNIRVEESGCSRRTNYFEQTHAMDFRSLKKIWIRIKGKQSNLDSLVFEILVDALPVWGKSGGVDLDLHLYFIRDQKQ